MAILAIPVFRSRVAPVFDSCLRVFLIRIEHDREAERSEIRLQNLSLTERVSILQKAGVTTLICGGISHTLHAMLESSGVSVITGIAGGAEEVLSAFMSHRLDAPKFSMPGRGGLRVSRHKGVARARSAHNQGTRSTKELT